MIFVTVGTTIPFDELFEEVDRLISAGVIADEVVCQIGQSNYIPSNCSHFRFKPNLDEYFEAADRFIVHGGTGSTLQALATGKPFVAFANPRGADDHQGQFLRQLSEEYPILWSRDVKELGKLVREMDDYNGCMPSAQSGLARAIKELIEGLR